MLEWHPNTQALAGAFAENVEAGLRGESADETVTSQCNVEQKDQQTIEDVEAAEGKKLCSLFGGIGEMKTQNYKKRSLLGAAFCVKR